MFRFIAELVSTSDTKETGSMISNKCFIDCPATDKIEGSTGGITATASALERTQNHSKEEIMIWIVWSAFLD